MDRHYVIFYLLQEGHLVSSLMTSNRNPTNQQNLGLCGFEVEPKMKVATSKWTCILLANSFERLFGIEDARPSPARKPTLFEKHEPQKRKIIRTVSGNKLPIKHIFFGA